MKNWAKKAAVLQLMKVFLLFVILVPESYATVLYVAVNGNDSNPGTSSAPFRTLDHARDVVRSQNSNMDQNITVYLRNGTYFLSSTFMFDQRDSGTNGYKVTYSSYPGE